MSYLEELGVKCIGLEHLELLEKCCRSSSDEEAYRLILRDRKSIIIPGYDNSDFINVFPLLSFNIIFCTIRCEILF